MTTTLRRAIFATPSALLAAAIAWLAVVTVLRGERTLLDWTLCALFVTVMAWESLVIVQIVLGFWSWGRGAAGLSDLERRARELAPVATGASRTAIVIPIFDEDVEAVFAGVAIMRRSLARLGSSDDIDLHVLSDTVDPATAEAERRAVAAMQAVPCGPRVVYRRRTDNAGRKAGNVCEFLERTRGAYDFMLVLDADSLMSGTAMRKLIRLMEENERVALIQTISYAANRMTLFARVQQFAVRLYAPLSLKGLAFWQGADGLYYGHNAIIRCAPFLEHARLPVLPGRPPLGGEILCHDVVEAALLRRAGWEVRVVQDIEDTWEEMPTNVVDLLGRERRWCQGNLQHIRVLPMIGLTAGSRTHIAMGILSYLVGPLWWAFVVLGACRALADPDGRDLGVLAYGATEHGPAAQALFWTSLATLLLPRSLNFCRALLGAAERSGFGGGPRLLASAVLEQVFSVLLTPLLSLVTARFTAQTFLGTVVAWDSQSRADRDVGWAEAFRVSRGSLALGLSLLAAALWTGGWYALLQVPVVLGLVCGTPLVVWSSRRSFGEAAFRRGLFLTPDETRPAVEIGELRSDAAVPPRLEAAE